MQSAHRKVCTSTSHWEKSMSGLLSLTSSWLFFGFFVMLQLNPLITNMLTLTSIQLIWHQRFSAFCCIIKLKSGPGAEDARQRHERWVGRGRGPILLQVEENLTSFPVVWIPDVNGPWQPDTVPGISQNHRHTTHTPSFCLESLIWVVLILKVLCHSELWPHFREKKRKVCFLFSQNHKTSGKTNLEL